MMPDDKTPREELPPETRFGVAGRVHYKKAVKRTAKRWYKALVVIPLIAVYYTTEYTSVKVLLDFVLSSL